MSAATTTIESSTAEPSTDSHVDSDLDLSTVVEDHIEIDCECMLCHLPLSRQHDPVQWRVVVHFPGPYPAPGDEAMLMCDECKVQWTEHTDEFPGDMSIARVHPI